MKWRVPTEGFPLWLGVALVGNPLGAFTAYGQGNPGLGTVFASLFAWSCWRLVKLLAEGGRDTDPVPVDTDQILRRYRTERLMEDARARAEWQAEYYRLTGSTWVRESRERNHYGSRLYLKYKETR